MMQEPFYSALPIIEDIHRAGFEAYFVGGSVRDYLLGKEIHDVDIATSATPEELKLIFPKTVDVGIAHGTIIIIHQGQGFEVTTYRTETEYKDYRRPESVAFVRSLTEDLMRRDFTMNAIAMGKDGTLIDPFHGRAALRNKVIETVGSADERFQEDALRLMRAVRFVSQLGFQLDKSTEKALNVHAPLLQYISVERVMVEMNKLLDGPYKSAALEIFLDSGLYKYVPSLFNESQVIQTVLTYPVSHISEDQMWLLALHVADESNAADKLKMWRLPSKKIKRLSSTMTYLKWRLQHDWTPYALFSAGRANAILVEAVYQVLQSKEEGHPDRMINQLFDELPIESVKEIEITGNDLLKWANKPGGPWVKEVLNEVTRSVLNKEVANDKNEIRRWIKACQLL